MNNTGIMKLRKYIGIGDVIICLLIAVFVPIISSYYNTGSLGDTVGQLFLKGLAYFFGVLFITFIFRFSVLKENNKNIKWLDKLFDKEKNIYKFRIVIIALFIFICWLPILIMLYPGTFANDTWGELGQYYFRAFNDHHPIFDTILFNAYFHIFLKVCNNWYFASFTYVLIQSVITSLVFAYSICYAKEKLSISDKWNIAFILLYALVPFFAPIVQNICKDGIFAWIYVLFIIEFTEIIRTKGESLNSFKSLFKFIAIIIFCCLTKKIGMYVLALPLVGLLFFKIKNKKKIIAVIGSMFILMLLIMPILIKIFNIQKGNSREKYTLLFQQTCRYLIYYSETDLTDNEKEIIEGTLGYSVEELKTNYNYKDGDFAKSKAFTSENSSFKQYLKVWIKQGLRHPNAYIDATFAMFSGWINNIEYKPSMNSDWHNQLTPIVENIDGIEEYIAARPEVFEKSSDVVENVYDNLYKIPVFNLLISKVTYFVLIPLISLLTIFKYTNKKEKIYYAFVIVPLLLSIILGLLLAPISDNIEGQRYAYPVIFTTITTIMWCIYVLDKYKEEKE